MFPGSTSRLVTWETPIFLHVVPSFIRGEAYSVNVHCIQIWEQLLLPEGSPFLRGILGDDVIIPSPNFPELYDVPVKFSHLVKPLFPSPSSFFLAQWKVSGGHHYGQLVGDSSLKGVYQNTVQVNSAMCLGQSKGRGVLVRVSVTFSSSFPWNPWTFFLNLDSSLLTLDSSSLFFWHIFAYCYTVCVIRSLAVHTQV